MVVLKFGGTSMANATRMMRIADIVCEQSQAAVVVSAVAGVSNILEKSIDSVLVIKREKGADRAKEYITAEANNLFIIHKHIIDELQLLQPCYAGEKALAFLHRCIDRFEHLMQAIVVCDECPETAYCKIMGLGEQISVSILAEIFYARSIDTLLCDSREIIITTGSQREGEPLYRRIESLLEPYRQCSKQVLLAAGFIASDEHGRAALLGRNGSDFSAALYAMGLHASLLEIWSDVDGVYTADPRIVSQAQSVEVMSYEEAMELSFFGSKVLHPKTIIPVLERNIEIRAKNTLNRNAVGTRIVHTDVKQGLLKTKSVCGITCLQNTVLLSVSGLGLKGKKGSAARVFSAVSKVGISVLLIAQSSSEYTISFAVRMSEADEAEVALKSEFEWEMRRNIINPISVVKNLSILSVVGDVLKTDKQATGLFFSSLSEARIPLYALAEGASRRSISAVIAQSDTEKAMNAAHHAFFSTHKRLHLVVFGTGLIGSELLSLIKKQNPHFIEQGFELSVVGLANSSHLLCDERGISLDSWKESLTNSHESPDLSKIYAFIAKQGFKHSIFVDCTANAELALQYPSILSHGMHIVTPNKRANSLSLALYTQIRQASSQAKKQFLYETTVGAALPIIGTLQNLRLCGDRVHHCAAMLSGSLSYIFAKLEEGMPFSAAVKTARELGYTEPDPRDDLFGTDVLRKTIILSREMGLAVEQADIRFTPLFPSNFDTSGTVESFLDRLDELDAFFAQKRTAAHDQGKVVSFIIDIRMSQEDYQISVGLSDVDKESPLASIKAGMNALILTSDYYSPHPLIIQGYGAGATVTANGVLADIISLR